MEYFLTATVQNSADITAVFEVRKGGAYSYTARITAATLDDAVKRLTGGQPGEVVLEPVPVADVEPIRIPDTGNLCGP